MPLESYVHHHLPGRLRLRVPGAKGNEALLHELSSALAKAPGVSTVEYNPVTGSILLQYAASQYRDLDSLRAGLNSSAVAIKEIGYDHRLHHGRHQRRHHSAAAARVDEFFRALDSEIRSATGNEIDLKFLLPFAIGLLGLVALRHGATTPLWLTLMIFAFHSFLGLHAPTTEELRTVESLAMDLEG